MNAAGTPCMPHVLLSMIFVQYRTSSIQSFMDRTVAVRPRSFFANRWPLRLPLAGAHDLRNTPRVRDRYQSGSSLYRQKSMKFALDPSSANFTSFQDLRNQSATSLCAIMASAQEATRYTRYGPTWAEMRKEAADLFKASSTATVRHETVQPTPALLRISSPRGNTTGTLRMEELAVARSTGATAALGPAADGQEEALVRRQGKSWTSTVLKPTYYAPGTGRRRKVTHQRQEKSKSSSKGCDQAAKALYKPNTRDHSYTVGRQGTLLRPDDTSPGKAMSAPLEARMNDQNSVENTATRASTEVQGSAPKLSLCDLAELREIDDQNGRVAIFEPALCESHLSPSAAAYDNSSLSTSCTNTLVVPRQFSLGTAIRDRDVKRRKTQEQSNSSPFKSQPETHRHEAELNRTLQRTSDNTSIGSLNTHYPALSLHSQPLISDSRAQSPLRIGAAHEQSLSMSPNMYAELDPQIKFRKQSTRDRDNSRCFEASKETHEERIKATQRRMGTTITPDAHIMSGNNATSTLTRQYSQLLEPIQDGVIDVGFDDPRDAASAKTHSEATAPSSLPGRKSLSQRPESAYEFKFEGALPLKKRVKLRDPTGTSPLLGAPATYRTWSGKHRAL